MNIECKNCGRSWNAIVTDEKCPFFGALPEKNDIDFSDFTEALKYLVSKFGVEIYRTPNKLVSVLSDLTPALDRERRRLKMCGEAGILTELLVISKNNMSA